MINNFTEFPTSIPSYPHRLHDAGYNTAYIGKWHMGEGNDEKRPGFDYWASHKGQGQYYDTPFNVDGQRQVIKGYYSHVVTDLATDWLKTARRPFSLTVGHKAPHGLWVPEPKYAHAFDNVDVRKPATAAPGPGTPDWVSRRIKTWHGIDGPLYGTNDFGKFIRTYHETILSVDDSVGADLRGAAGDGRAGQHHLPLRRRQRLPARRARVDRQAHDVGGEHPDSAAGALPGIVRDGRSVVDRMVLNLDVAPSVLDLCGAPALGGVHGSSFKDSGAGPGAPWRSSWMYEYNFEKEFPYTPNVRGVRTDAGATCTIRTAKASRTPRRQSSTTSRTTRWRSTT